jgi:hypothetical protein
VAVAIGLVVTAVAVIAVLSDSEPRLAATNTRVQFSGKALDLDAGQERCQGGEYVPAGTDRLRVFGESYGPPESQPLVATIKTARGDVVATGRLAGGVRATRLDITFPALQETLDPGQLCLRNEGRLDMAFAGNLTPANRSAAPGPNAPGQRDTDEIRADWYRPGSESWWSVAGAVAKRMAMFKPSFTGSWLLWAVLVAIGLLWVLAIATLLRGGRWRPRRRLPTAAWTCAIVAIGNAWVWALVTPPFQVPDEGVHIGYSEYVAETGKPPRRFARPISSLSVYSEEYTAIYNGLPFSPEGKPSWSPALDRQLRDKLDEPLEREEELGAGTAATYPPGYYAYEAVAARLGRPLDALDRLFLLRAWSALLAGLTVLCTFLFIREALPGAPWTWSVGALAVAFQPLFSFLSGGVNNDGLLYLAGAALLAFIARGFRRGLTLRVGAGMGLATATGLLTKPTMMGLVPAMLVALAVLLWRDWRHSRPVGAVVAGVGLPLAMVGGWLALDVTVFNRPAGAMTGNLVTDRVAAVTSISGQLTYLWQFYLPRLPFMEPQFTGWTYPLWHVYIQGFVGRFGWFEYDFPTWVSVVGLIVLGAIAAMAIVTLVRHVPAVRRRWVELATYVVAAGGVLLMIGVSGYRYRASLGFNFEQTRYLFPLLALYGGTVALAARAGGRRWGPVIGASMVVVMMAHWLFAILLTLDRYYA